MYNVVFPYLNVNKQLLQRKATFLYLSVVWSANTIWSLFTSAGGTLTALCEGSTGTVGATGAKAGGKGLLSLLVMLLIGPFWSSQGVTDEATIMAVATVDSDLDTKLSCASFTAAELPSLATLRLI